MSDAKQSMAMIPAVLYAAIFLSAAGCGRAPQPASPVPLAKDSAETNFIFAVCGDNRNGDEVYGRILRTVVADNAAFLINTGDLVPTGSPAYWKKFERLMTGFSIPFCPVAGNHDRDRSGLTGFARWTPGRQLHYSFDWGELHFTMANDSVGEMSEAELAWLDADLSATKKPVKITVHHMPAWSTDEPVYGMSGGNDAFLALLKRHGVRYDLCGHDHGYRMTERDGTILIVSAGGGAPLYHPPEEGGFHHYVRFTVRGTNVTFEPIKIPALTTLDSTWGDDNPGFRE